MSAPGRHAPPAHGSINVPDSDNLADGFANELGRGEDTAARAHEGADGQLGNNGPR